MKQIIHLLFLCNAMLSFGQWQQTNGPYSSLQITDIISFDSVLFASSPCGTYISDFNGEEWTPLSSSNFNASIVFKNELYLGGGELCRVSKNKDQINKQSILNYYEIIDLNSDDNTIYAAIKEFGFAHSNDGETWEFYNKNLPPIANYFTPNYYSYETYTIAVNENYVFVGTNKGVYRTDKTNYNWIEVSSNTINGKVNALLCLDSVIFAGTENQLFKSDNNGKDWILSYSFSENTKIRKIKCLNDSIYALTDVDGIYCSPNFGTNWTEQNNGLTNYGCYSLTSHFNQLFLANESGVYKYKNRWLSSSNNIICSSIIGLTKTDSCIAAVDFFNVYISRDDGQSWENSTENLNKGILWNVVNINDSLLFTAESPLYSPFRELVFTSSNNGRYWLSRDDLPFENPILRLEASNNKVILFGNETVLLSEDIGKTWIDISPKTMKCNNINDALITGSTIYLSSCGARDILRSNDLGKSWESITNDLPGYEIYKLGECQGTIFGATNFLLFRLEPGNNQWEYSGIGIQKIDHNETFNVQDFASNENYYFMCFDKKVFASKDKGKSWTDIGEGLPEMNINKWGGALLLDGETLYFGTNNYGVWKRNVANLNLPTQQTESDEEITIYPNPTSGIIYFELPINDVGEWIEIFDSYGNEILFKKMNSHELDISNLSNGLYFVKVKTIKKEYISKIIKR